MKLSTREEKIQKMMHTGIQNIFQTQDVLSFDQFAVTTLEILMLLEREEYLKNQVNGQDIGNGTYLRNFMSLRKNSLQVNIPRTRSGKFKPIVLEMIEVHKEQVNELALILYSKGLSSREVSSVIETYFGESMSRETVNNLAESYHEIRKNWENRPLDPRYKAIFCDATFVPLRRGDSYSNEAVYICYGVKEDNTRELLSLEVNPTESSSMWDDYFLKLKNKGVKEIDLAIADGLSGFSEAFHKHYPKGDVQRCVVHLQRNLLKKVRPKDKPTFGADLKEVFNNFSKDASYEDANRKLDEFVSKWVAIYPTIAYLKDECFINEYFTYIQYNEGVRRYIYTTNSIESLNAKVKRVTKTKLSFEKESNLLDLVFMIIMDHEEKSWQRHPVTAFSNWSKKTQSV